MRSLVTLQMLENFEDFVVAYLLFTGEAVSFLTV
jgi:hypothetical protein